jgi:hypothetical protein
VAPSSATPLASWPHGAPVLRGLESTPASSTATGRFGRMFRHVPVYEHRVRTLIALGQSMIHPDEREDDGKLDKPLGTPDEDENVTIPAGYTYFGQFVDHDITFDPVSSLTRRNDPDALTDFRTPRFDLDSLYGRGPSDEPYLYQQRPEPTRPDGSEPPPPGLKLLLDPMRPDLQRNGEDRALIGDPRNDENLIVSQLQVAFIRFHNAVVEHLWNEDPHTDPSSLFDRAQRTARWHYQWVVIHDFLGRLVGDAVIDDILSHEDYRSPNDAKGARTVKPRLLFYHWNEQPFMPVEFSVAAYRFGHSMVRPSYVINDFTRDNPQDPTRHRIPIFSDEADRRDNLEGLNGFRRLPTDGELEWKYFLPGIDGGGGPGLPQPSYKIDTQLNARLGCLPPSVVDRAGLSIPGVPQDVATEALQSLAVRNLLRGHALGLPDGQDVARAMGITPMVDDELRRGVELDETLLAKLDLTREDVEADLLTGRTPLWFYVLKEAELRAGGAQLGPVGGRIVAEVLIGLLASDRLSFLSVDPTWKPTLPGLDPETFTLTDVINLGLPAERPS